MTRPQIIRADTIDLQHDQLSPSAQDHSRKPQNGTNIGPTAPHQASELRHIQEERHLEEEHLSNAWNRANSLSGEPPSEEEERYANGMNAEQREGSAIHQNGNQSGAGEDTDMDDHDGDADSMDDDMMDKISSSPSISDGGLFHTTPWPRRGSSLNPPTPPCGKLSIRHFSMSSDDAESGASSPFVDTPLHLPLQFSFSYPNTHLVKVRSRPNTPLQDEEPDSSSPFTSSPAHFPIDFHKPHHSAQSARHHHRMVKYSESQDHMEDSDNKEEDESFAKTELENLDEEVRDAIGPMYTKQRYFVPPNRGQQIFCQQSELVKSASDMELERQLLPIDDPALAEVSDDSSTTSAAESINDVLGHDDDEDWETDSADAYSRDSFESVLFNDDDDNQSAQLPSEARFVDSGWGGECLRETEDIDFEFVYALHTFVATVEGQANAQKGDTMVLLDDSNSYWWLVRVVKDSTIGYLPAEHIETPTERLARLNKHRNVDLSQTMLGDTTEKTKNPLKKPFRRRTGKTVTFSAPTYVEPSDYEFSSEDDTGDDISPPNGDSRSEEEKNNTEAADQDEITAVAPLSVRQSKRDISPEKKAAGEEDRGRTTSDDVRSSDELFDREFSGSGKSRNGTVRNTDSFFRDESIETRKITLTPNLLRDDSSSITSRPSNDRGPSFELIEKELRGDGKPAKVEKKKEKKPGLLGGLFKRSKDKKLKAGDGDRNGKLSGETLRESPSLDTDEASPIERPAAEKQVRQEVDLGRTGSRGKLQKSPPSPLSPSGTLSPTGSRQADPISQKIASDDPVSVSSSSQSTPRATSPTAVKPGESAPKVSMLTDISNKLRSPVDSAKPEKVKRAKTREALDVGDTPEEEKADPFGDEAEISELEPLQPPPGVQKAGAMSSTERLSESPVHVTAADAHPDSEPPALVGDSSSSSSADELASLRSSPSPPMMTSAPSQDANHMGLRSSPTLSPESHSPTYMGASGPFVANRQVQPQSYLPPPPTRSPPPQPAVSPSPLPPMTMNAQTISTPARNNSTSTVASTLSPTTSTIPPWSDAHLRAYLDDPADIRDLLLVVHDTSGVVPVGPDHPLMSNLFVEERGKVQEMNSALDTLLGQWLAKKRRPGGVGLSRKSSTNNLTATTAATFVGGGL